MLLTYIIMCLWYTMFRCYLQRTKPYQYDHVILSYVWEKSIISFQEIYCTCCCKHIHRNCCGLLCQDFATALQDTSWFCRMCMENFLPFNHIDDESTFLNVVSEISQCQTVFENVLHESMLFNPFDINEEENDITEYHGDLDPDKCYNNQFSHNLIKNCNYFVEDAFNKYLSRHHIPHNAFPLLHLNIRSVPANFTYFLSYINNLNHDFSVIGLSETWLKQSNISAYGIDGYSHIGLTRSNGTGGVVSLLISDEFILCELTEYSMLTEHIECLFAKITSNKFTCIIGIVYRPLTRTSASSLILWAISWERFPTCPVIYWVIITLTCWNMIVISKQNDSWTSCTQILLYLWSVSPLDRQKVQLHLSIMYSPITTM